MDNGENVFYKKLVFDVIIVRNNNERRTTVHVGQPYFAKKTSSSVE